MYSVLRRRIPCFVLLVFLTASADWAEAGTVTTLAGSLNRPVGVAVDSAGNVYVSDTNNNRILMIDPAGTATTLAGSGAFAHTNGTGVLASFGLPAGLAVDGAGNLFVAEAGGVIRKIAPGGVVTTFAQVASESSVLSGLTIDSAGYLYVADLSAIWKISPAGQAVPLPISDSFPNSVAVDGAGSLYYCADGKLFSRTQSGATAALSPPAFFSKAPTVAAVAIDGSGNVYAADDSNNVIYRMTPSGVWSILAGSGVAGDADGTGTTASFSGPSGLAVDGAGNLYVTESVTTDRRGRVRKIAFASDLTNIPAPADYDGDGKKDIAIYRTTTGTWWIIRSSDGAVVSRGWGLATDLPQPFDYDGDGKADITAYRPSDGSWWIQRSSDGTVQSRTWGQAGDVPVPRDYDGDGKTDIAVYRPSTGTWWIIRSSDGAVVSRQWGGLPTDLPVPGDFDGDGKRDIAIYRMTTGTWWIIRSSDGAVVSRQWGLATDIPIPGDFDGDGKADIAVYRPTDGSWWIQRSSDGTVQSRTWGQLGDVPVPADYDGDGKTDIAVYRPSTGTWWIIRSSDGAVVSRQWGLLTDSPVVAPEQ